MSVASAKSVRATPVLLLLVALAHGAACDRVGPPSSAAAAAAATTRPSSATRDEPSLTFARDGREVRALTRSELLALGDETVVTNDPYYHRVKRFRAVALERILAAAFGTSAGGAPLATQQFLLRARDGYTVPMTGERLLEGGAFVAVEDLDAPGWEPIGPQRSNPAPFYFVWREAAQQNLETHPRPWQLARIEIAAFEAVFPHTVPFGEPADGPAMEGFRRFRGECVRCHAMNREGGRVGPELNVPQSIVEYRPEAQVRAYVRNPLAFRYGAMPAHPHLTDRDLDALIAYFRAMSVRKNDPDADAGAHLVGADAGADAGALAPDVASSPR